MKYSIIMIKALFIGASLLSLALPVNALAGNVTVVSDSSWNVFVTDANNNQMWLGISQNVCLNTTNPSNCPVGAIPAPTLYGYTPNITGASSPAASQEFTFKTEFYVCDPPEDATISVAADDFAEVSVNGTIVPNSTSTSPNQLTTFNVPASSIYGSTLLNIRSNSITVKARNGLNPSDCRSDQYKCNPAGVILGASFKFTGNPTCAGFNGGTYSNGQSEKLANCPSGQFGSVSHTCLCGNWTPNITSCVTPPHCTGNNGITFNVDDVESQSCPTGQIASPSTHTCLSNENWDVPLGTCTLPLLGAGAMCASDRGNLLIGICPAGTTCAGRRIAPPPRPWWCAITTVASFLTLGISPTPAVCAPVASQTTDWFCDP
jgi:hypothetical protein